MNWPCPRSGDYHALPHEGEGRALVRTRDGVRTDLQRLPPPPGGDAARPRPARSGHIVCPLHRWTYDLHGQLIGAPHFEHDPCLNLHNYPLQQLERPAVRGQRPRRRRRAGRACGPHAALDFSGYVLDHVELHECDYNWKTFIEVYLEDYHVGPVPPRAGPLRHLRRPALGVRRPPFGADGGRAQRARAGRARRSTSAGTRRC